MTSNDPARPRGTHRIAQDIRSHRLKDGPLSIFNRLNEAAIDACAAHIAGANAYRELDKGSLTRSIQLYVQKHPGAASTTEEMTAILRTARYNDAQPIPIRDLDRKTLARMTAKERLDVVNGAGVSARFKLLGPDDAE